MRTELANVEAGTQLSIAAKQLQSNLLTVERLESEASLRNSIAGRLGGALEPISRLAGFDWRTNIALVGGFAAKEVVVSTLGTAYSLGEVEPEETGGLASRLANAPGWSPLVAFSLIIFTIFYAHISRRLLTSPPERTASGTLRSVSFLNPVSAVGQRMRLRGALSVTTLSRRTGLTWRSQVLQSWPSRRSRHESR